MSAPAGFSFQEDVRRQRAAEMERQRAALPDGGRGAATVTLALMLIAIERQIPCGACGPKK